MTAANSTSRLHRPRRPHRLHLNPDRVRTRSSTGLVLRQHASNVLFAVHAGVDFTHVVLHASTSRFFVGGGAFESYVNHYEYSHLKPVGVEEGHVDPAGREHRLQHSWSYIKDDFRRYFPAGTKIQVAFATHEGSFYPRALSEEFAHFLLENTTYFKTAKKAATIEIEGHRGVACEEIYWPSFALTVAGARMTISAPGSREGPKEGGTEGGVRESTKAKEPHPRDGLFRAKYAGEPVDCHGTSHG